jgi:hypothetical protein
MIIKFLVRSWSKWLQPRSSHWVQFSYYSTAIYFYVSQVYFLLQVFRLYFLCTFRLYSDCPCARCACTWLHQAVPTCPTAFWSSFSHSTEKKETKSRKGWGGGGCPCHLKYRIDFWCNIKTGNATMVKAHRLQPSSFASQQFWGHLEFILPVTSTFILSDLMTYSFTSHTSAEGDPKVGVCVCVCVYRRPARPSVSKRRRE